MRPCLPPASKFAAPRRPLSGIATATALILLLGSQVPAAETPATAELGTRVALVIGNGAYGELGTLPNPPNDASDVRDALNQLDFKVTLIVDGNADEMRRALRDFASSASGADVALFYYAGHGMALKGENYLVPVKSHIENELDLSYETLALDDVREALEFTDAKLKMVILDACRDNPLSKLLARNQAQLGRGFQANDGLAPMDVEQASGMFIAYATAPGNVALDGSNQRNSPFTKALLTHIAMQNTDVRVMFGQVRADVLKATNNYQTPWTEEAMLGEFEFNPVEVAPPPPTPPSDYVAWSAVAQSEDPADLEAFLEKYPESSLAGAARASLRILRDPATELAAWTKLRGSGDTAAYETFLHRYPEGSFAYSASLTLQGLLWAQLAASRDVAGMEAFIERFPDAPLTPVARATIEQLRTSLAAAPAPAPPPPPAASAEPPPVVAAEPEAVMTPPAFEAAVTPPASKDITVAMAEPPTAPAPPAMAPADAGPERALILANPPMDEPAASGVSPMLTGLPSEADLSPEAVRRLTSELPAYLMQIALKALDYYHGTLDGKFGPASRRSAAAFQEAIGADPTGDLRPAEIVTLIAEAARGGDADSQNTYGGMLETGAGVIQDPVAAAKWYRLSADAGNAYGQMNLALLYMRGIGVDRDPAQAKHWLEAAKANGLDAAGERLKELQ